jgi:glycosyltransferase involved in cell wall biosynthesis
MWAIVPAHNEDPTVGDVVSTLVAADVFEGVLVVDDGSSDRTGEVAENAGATVLRLEKNRGKGGAMLAAYKSLPVENTDDRVAFFDADLTSLTTEQVRHFAYVSSFGYDMVSLTQPRWIPLGYLTGERILRRWVLDALPLDCWNGYSIETAMNWTIAQHGGKSVRLPGVDRRSRLDKIGVVAGLRGHVRTIQQILQTRRALARTGGASCRPLRA